MIRSHTSYHAYDVAQFIVKDSDDVIVIKLRDSDDKSQWTSFTMFLYRSDVVRLGDAIAAYLGAKQEAAS